MVTVTLEERENSLVSLSLSCWCNPCPPHCSKRAALGVPCIPLAPCEKTISPKTTGTPYNSSSAVLDFMLQKRKEKGEKIIFLTLDKMCMCVRQREGKRQSPSSVPLSSYSLQSPCRPSVH